MQAVDFGLSNGLRYLKIDARSGVFRVKDGDAEITFSTLIALMNLAHVRVGWFAFTPNGVSFVEGVKTPQPAAIGDVEYKLGIGVRLFSADQPAGCAEALGEREITTTSFLVRRAFAELYQDFAAQADGHNGEWPVVQCTGFRKTKLPKGVAYLPLLRITGWQTPPEPVPDIPAAAEDALA